MTVEELLLELKDIQPPPEPAWWLLAPAHWIAILLLLGVAVCIWFFLRHRRSNRLASLAEQELQRIRSSFARDEDSQRLAIELSRWLKQVAILAFPERHLESLSGKGWLEFLDESLGNNNFSDGTGMVFGSMIYSKQINLDATQLVPLCEQWLSVIKPHLRQRGIG
ncbi:MAG: DUF4381 domain-containing protein [Gammaproteobacteria bacterium]|nr:DUF4381 domain-containing protein [Gammaproteobacteria bacterium]